MRRFTLVAGLVVVAGTPLAFGQPVLDGQKDALYGAPKWLQSVATSFGDNRTDLCTSVGNRVSFAINNINAAGVSGGTGAGDPLAAALVATGVEIRIPLSQLGNPTGAIRIAGFINGGGSNYLSNQVIGGFTTPRGNLGGDGSGGFTGGAAGIDFSNATQCPGQQFVSVPFSAAAVTAPALDGTLDAAFYGAALFAQNTQTGFGDSNLGQIDNANGSEIDAVYARTGTANVGDGTQAYLWVLVTGNVESNFNRLNLFIDTGAAGGQHVLTNTNPAADGLNTMSGLTFETGFAANYYMDFRCGGGPFGIYSDFAKLNPGGGGGFIGGGAAATAIIGSGSGCPPDQAVAVGSELDGLYSYVDRTNNKLYLMFTGNLKGSDFITLFFDANGNPAGDEGQDVVHGSGSLLARNVLIGIADGGAGSLNRLGFLDATNPGLTFDTGFFADYYLNAHVENTNRIANDSAVLRKNGRRENGLGSPLDFGVFVGVDIPNVNPYDGTAFCCPFPGGIQRQDGFQTDVNSHYPARESNRVLQGYLDSNAGNYPASDAIWADWLGVLPNLGNPVAPANLLPRSGLIRSAIDNGNVLGVSDTSGAGAATAVKGFEISINLSELGYNQRSRIRVAGFLNADQFILASNQVLGASTGAANLGDPRLVNFNTFAGNQYVVVASCVADFNEDGVVAVSDIFDFLAAWFGGDPRADINGGGLGVSDIFDFLGLWFSGPCIGG